MASGDLFLRGQEAGGTAGASSLPEVHRSVAVSERGWLRRLLSFAGPGFL